MFQIFFVFKFIVHHVLTIFWMMIPIDEHQLNGEFNTASRDMTMLVDDSFFWVIMVLHISKRQKNIIHKSIMSSNNNPTVNTQY
jgi:hypothetical protein